MQDNGVGMSRECLDKILEVQPDAPLSGGIGIGLSNVHARIQRLFGNEYGISLESKENGGTCVSLRLPWQEVH